MAMRVSVLTGMPMIIVLSAAAYSVNGLLFSTLDGSWSYISLNSDDDFPNYDDDHELDLTRDEQSDIVYGSCRCRYSY